MGPGKSGRLTPAAALLIAVLMLLAACAGSADDRDERAAEGTVLDTGDTATTDAGTADVAAGQDAPEPAEPDRNTRPDRPQVAGGYTAAEVVADIVIDSAEVVEAALAYGLDELLAAAEAGTLQLNDAQAVADCDEQQFELGDVREAATQVVAGRNVWLTADYSCSEVAGILSAIVYWDLEREPRLTDLDLEFTVGDFSPVDQ